MTGAGAPVVVVHPDAGVLAAAAAARTITHLVDAQAARGTAHLVVTGGGLGTAVLRVVRDSPARDAVDWRAVHVWWGDERFLPSGDPERNETQAREALLDHVPLDPAHVHVMAPSDGPLGDDVDGAARAYADELAAAAGEEGDAGEEGAARGPATPRFDVVHLGVGPDGHVASLFPGHPGTQVEDLTVIGVRGSPKPPPVRVSLTFPVLDHAREVLLVASGEAKAGAVARALGGAPRTEIPASSPRGTIATRWLLDRAAAAHLPRT